MITEAKLAANRANAQKSTGPATPEGKTRSSRNSFKHGLYSKQLVVGAEEAAALDELKSNLRAEHQPVNETEGILVNELAEQFWRLRRARAYEARLLDSSEVLIPHLNLVQRMMSSAERGFHKALTALRRLQKDRGFVPANSTSEPAEPQPSRDCQGAVGFVSQSDQNPDCQGGVKLTAEQSELPASSGFVPANSTSEPAEPQPSRDCQGAVGFVSQSDQNPDCQGGVKLTAEQSELPASSGFVPPPSAKDDDLDPTAGSAPSKRASGATQTLTAQTL